MEIRFDRTQIENFSHWKLLVTSLSHQRAMNDLLGTFDDSVPRYGVHPSASSQLPGDLCTFRRSVAAAAYYMAYTSPSRRRAVLVRIYSNMCQICVR